MGIADDTDTASARLHQLSTYFRTHPATGPTERTSRSTTPGAPLNLGVVDHITRAVAEVVDHTRTVNPDAGPLPAHVAAVYDWCREHTQHAPEIEQQRRETLELRHRLEHAVQAGDGLVVRPIRCPACGTIGVHWNAQAWRAVCLNRNCARRNDGVSQTWTLAQLAHHQISAQKSLRDCAT